MTNKPLVVATPFLALLPAKPAAAITTLTGNQYKNRYKEDLQTELNDTMERILYFVLVSPPPWHDSPVGGYLGVWVCLAILIPRSLLLYFTGNCHLNLL